MRRIFLFALYLLIVIGAVAQKNKKEILEFCIGRLAFGTGDFFGYGANVGYERQLNPNNNFLKHFSAQAELSFEYGKSQPKVFNATLEEFYHQHYYSTANVAIIPKIAYHPFNKTFLKGFNFSAGISLGYTNQNREFEATYIYDWVSQSSLRRSYLEYINQFIFGYRVSAGYEYAITKHVLIGARMDFENYFNLGDINTLLAGKIGYNF